jgi:hypothetical protein
LKYLLGLLILFSSLFGEKTLCYKNNLDSSTQRDGLPLNGGKCQNIFTASDMIKNGWKLEDFKAVQTNNKYNQIFIFSRKTELDKLFEQGYVPESKISIKPRKFNKNETVIYDVTDTTAKIKLGNLREGQSGAIVNSLQGNYTIITQAIVTKTTPEYSELTFVKDEILKQNVLPKLKSKPQNSDLFILNHLYKSSLLIVPNAKAKKLIYQNFPKQNFMSEDFFAFYLKANNTPVPTKRDLIEFCNAQQIGTIFIVVRNKLYVIDSLSFKTIDEIYIDINDKSTQLPFLTKINEIEKAFWDFGGAENIGSYNNFYLSLIKDTGYTPAKDDSIMGSIFNKLTEIFPW